MILDEMKAKVENKAGGGVHMEADDTKRASRIY